jgi:porphobilinogen synthase
MRELVAEFRVRPENLMLPIFIREGLARPRPIDGMYSVMQHTTESFLEELDRAIDAGIKSVMIFAVPESRDAVGSQSCLANGILAKSVRLARAHVGESLVLVADLCLDEFTDHGHCGVLDSRGNVDNDETLRHYERMALQLARAGADMLGTSGMMDGQVGAIRRALDAEGHTDTGIVAYATKYASSFYGPFRNAVESQLTTNRRTYQQDWRNFTESLREIQLDLDEGADVIMVKPAMSYLDVVRAASEISDVPIAAYQVSGEYAMIEAASSLGHIDRQSTILESLHSIRRAGATIICTYFAIEAAKWIGEKK